MEGFLQSLRAPGQWPASGDVTTVTHVQLSLCTISFTTKKLAFRTGDRSTEKVKKSRKQMNVFEKVEIQN